MFIGPRVLFRSKDRAAFNRRHPGDWDWDWDWDSPRYSVVECADGGVARVLGRGLAADGQLVVLVLNSFLF